MYALRKLASYVCLFFGFFTSVIAIEKTKVTHHVSMKFDQVPIRIVLETLARSVGKNVLVDEQVHGMVQLNLQDVDFHTALQGILSMYQLSLQDKDNIWLVHSKTNLNAQESGPQAEISKIDVKHMSVDDLANQLRDPQNHLLSPQGRIMIDDRQQRLLIYDLPENIKAIKQVASALDHCVKQVHIEARIVTIDQGLDESLGIRWASRPHSDAHLAGSIEALAGSHSITDHLLVNLPVANASGRLAYRLAKLNNRHILDLELSALEKEDKAEIIASPSVLTMDRSTALIEQGTEIPYVESASSGATSVVFKKAVLSLSVKPKIAADGQVFLDLNLTQDTQGETVSTPTGPAVSINAQTMQTLVSVRSGQTLVLGGIYQKIVIKNETKVPWLGDIRWIGALFRQTRYEQRKRELMIFVTPSIIEN